MEYTRVIKDFSSNKYSDGNLIKKGNAIIGKLTGNTHFPTPFPLLTDLIGATAEFTAGVAKSVDGTREDTTEKNTLREGYEFLLKKIAQYCETESDGDEAAIESAGFDIYKKAAPVGPLPQPTSLIIRYGINSGEVTLECEKIPNARNYDFQYTDTEITPETQWVTNLSSKRRINLNGLTSGKYYEFRVAAINTDPQCNWSEPIRKLMV